MSEYERLVSYIYLYDKGIKVKNSGFAKIECKDNVLRIKMNLKGAFNNYYEQWKVYLLTEEYNEILGIYVGDIKGKGTSAEFQLFSPADSIGGTTKTFRELKGLAVISTGAKKYATFWKDTNLTIENFKNYEEKSPDKKYISFEKKRTERDIQDIYQNEYLKAMAVDIKEENKTDVKKEEEKQEKIREETNTDIQEKNKEQNDDVQMDSQEETIEQQVRYENNIKEKNLQKEDLQEKNLNENWEEFLTQYKRIHPFSDKEEIQCIRIELKDLRILPKSQWVLSSNSFVLHGFYNYQYLILGKVNNRFILGVPGVFCNKEKLVAGLFGFNDFKPAQSYEYKTGRFGYWYRYL